MGAPTSFDQIRNQRMQNSIESGTPVSAPVPTSSRPDFNFPPPKVKRKAYNVYLEVSLMEQIEEIANRKGISKSAALETCLKRVLKEMQNND